MKEKTIVIKDDINFLEYPNWIVGKRDNYKIYVIEKPNGKYLISTTEDIDRLPDKSDKIVLYYLLKIVLSTNNNKIETTRYNILKNSIGRTSKKEYEKLIDSLERWLALKIKFQGIFYDGDGYTTRGFHILEGYKLNEDGKLEIHFNEQYLEQLRNTNYFKFINFDEYKLLKRPVAARLYEILIKTFKGRDEWQIDIVKLGEKLTLRKLYPSQIYEKLIPAINEINKNTDLKIELYYDKKNHICTFTKVKKTQPNDEPDEPKETRFPEDNGFKSLIVLIPEEHQEKKTILEAVAKAYKKHGFDSTARNIRYTNCNCKGNYRVYLNKALKEDWGLDLKEDEEAKQKIIDKQQEQKRQEREALDRQKEMRCKVQDYIKKLSSEKLELIREEAVGRLDEKMKKYAEEYEVWQRFM